MANILEQVGMGESVLTGKKAWTYAEEILLQVSRTFALNINVLKGKLHKSILLAYLFLRIADTVEDDPVMDADEKEHLLSLFADIFRTADLAEEAVEAFENALPDEWRRSEHPYMNLCLHTHVVVPLLKELPEVYASPVRDVTIEMCGGMAQFAKRQEEALSQGWFTLFPLLLLCGGNRGTAAFAFVCRGHVLYWQCPQGRDAKAGREFWSCAPGGKHREGLPRRCGTPCVLYPRGDLP